MISFATMFGPQAEVPRLIEAQADSPNRQAQHVDAVGLGLRDDMTDSELERHIQDCGGHMLNAMARWERSSCFSDRGEAAYWWRMQKQAIAMRSPEQVARMEKERGLA